jgi:hypothetical protein
MSNVVWTPEKGWHDGPEIESLDETVARLLAGKGGTMGAVADGLTALGLGKDAR